jgi:5-oxoprolinase (ATP-hydrolysing)/N-methylhydantoinase A
MRLVGQMHEINVPLPAGAIDGTALDAVRAAFADVYAQRYTAVYADAAIEAISFRVRVVGPAPPLDLDQTEPPAPGRSKHKGVRQAWFGDGFVEAAVYDRYALAPGDDIEGPAIVEEREATTVVPPGDRLTVHGSRRIRRSPKRCAASRLIRSRSKSCGAASSPWSTRCGSRCAARRFR